MAISNVNTGLASSSQDALSAVAASSTPAANTNSNASWTGQQQASAVVSISSRGQALSRSSNATQSQQANQSQNNAAYNRSTNPTAENREGHLQEAAEKPGIRMLETEKNNTPTQGSRVNTFV